MGTPDYVKWNLAGAWFSRVKLFLYFYIPFDSGLDCDWVFLGGRGGGFFGSEEGNTNSS